MPFAKRNTDAEIEEAQDVEEFLAELEDPPLASLARDLGQVGQVVVINDPTGELADFPQLDAEDAEGADGPRARASKKGARKLLIGAAIGVGLLWLLSRWASAPAESQPERSKKNDGDDSDAELVLGELEVRLDAAGYSIGGERISSIGDGPAGFFLAAALEQRGAIPGETTIVLDLANAPHAHASTFETALKERGFKTAIKKLGAAG